MTLFCQVEARHVVNGQGTAVVVETLSLSPRVYKLYNFMDDAEAEQVRALLLERKPRSTLAHGTHQCIDVWRLRQIIQEALAIKEEEFKLQRSSTGTKVESFRCLRTALRASMIPPAP